MKKFEAVLVFEFTGAMEMRRSESALVFASVVVCILSPTSLTDGNAADARDIGPVTQRIALSQHQRAHVENVNAVFPDASNTGVPQGTNLTRHTGTLHITTDNAVIENLEIDGNIIIDAKNVTLKNIKLTTDDFNGIEVMGGATGFTLMDSEIDGGGTAHNGLMAQGTILRTNIHGVENGMTLYGPSEIRDNYIHGLAGDASSHFDGIEINGGHDIQILHNTVINPHDQTAAIMLDNWAAGLSNIKVDGNYLEGGGYTLYLDDNFSGGPVDDASISITNNQVGGGHWGDFALFGNTPVMSGNVDVSTGRNNARGAGR
ncbi:hypothetical protein PYH37_000328 [Sinorhizobium numidicum]|uniref:Right handed beta helix domain-containing protein n=1 Tax=Sinorhizobium numidicum TaxID=680248 RepID=A0ABY8CW83_9HYPH|nr:hypothetical protein [Sinorhizobium numidicum]WEX75004.1 hypothetical protein PYH37_000328 [Sinorhizobium numidicum]WEX80998.1 hypothetical protein PYH38_000330 [Sinorhizobium numidicum]